jgi:hypothetical protein
LSENLSASSGKFEEIDSYLWRGRMAVFHALLWLSLVASLQIKLQPDILNQTWPRKSTIDEKSGDTGVLRHPEKTVVRLPDSWRLGESNLLATHAKVSWSLFMVARSTRDHLKSHERFSVGMVFLIVLIIGTFFFVAKFQ